MDGWLATSFVVLFLLAGTDLMHRFLIREGYAPTELVLYVLLVAVVVGLAYTGLVRRGAPLRMPWRPVHAVVFLVCGVLFFFSFVLQRYAQIHSPNIGYVNAIVYSSVLITIVATAVLFRDRMDPRGLVGAALIIAGLVLIGSLGNGATASSG